MAGRKAIPPRATASVQVPAVDDAGTQRALDVLAGAIQQLQANRAAAAKPVSGSRSSGAALESLLEVLAELGIIVDETSA